MIKLEFEYYKNINESFTQKDVVASARKICNLYESARIKLEKNGNKLLKKDGCRNYLLLNIPILKDWGF